jgi:hypothetical protein
MSTEAEKFAPTGRRGDPGASGPGLALAQSGDDTDYDYYDTPSGNIWRPRAEPGQPPATSPGGRVAALLPFPDLPHVAFPPRARIRMP